MQGSGGYGPAMPRAPDLHHRSRCRFGGKQPEELVGQKVIELFETDPDNPDQGTQRPFGFQLKAHTKLNGLTVRYALGKSGMT